MSELYFRKQVAGNVAEPIVSGQDVQSRYGEPTVSSYPIGTIDSDIRDMLRMND